MQPLDYFDVCVMFIVTVITDIFLHFHEIPNKNKVYITGILKHRNYYMVNIKKHTNILEVNFSQIKALKGILHCGS